MHNLDLVGVGAVLVGVSAVITAWRTNRKVDDVSKKVAGVDKKVDTLNESTLGQLGAATETRRIHAKEAAGESVSEKEQRHIEAAEEEDA